MLPWLSGNSFLTVGGTLSPFADISRALGLRGGLGRCGHQAPHEKAPNGVSCHSRHWPFRSLAVALSSRQLKALGMVVWDCYRKRTPREHGGVGEGSEKRRKARKLGGSTGESIQCLGMHWRSPQKQLRPLDLWNVKRWENPERFGRQGRLGKGAWADTSKEPRGIPRQLALCALLRAPEPGLIPLTDGRATNQSQKRPSQPMRTLGAVKAH